MMCFSNKVQVKLKLLKTLHLNICERKKKSLVPAKSFSMFLRRTLKFETLGRFIFLKNAYTVYNFWAW